MLTSFIFSRGDLEDDNGEASIVYGVETETLAEAKSKLQALVNRLQAKGIEPGTIPIYNGEEGHLSVLISPEAITEDANWC